MVAHPYQYKAAALPETPQLRRIAKADGKIITLRRLHARAGNQLLTDAFALAGGVHRDTAYATPNQRRG